MVEKSTVLEKSKELYITFSQVLSDFSPESTLGYVQQGLDHILDIFDVLDHIVSDYELLMINPHIHSIFG